MKLTETKLKQLILSEMRGLFGPSKRVTFEDALSDPDVHPKIKNLLSSGEEEYFNQGLSLLSSLHGEKYDVDDPGFTMMKRLDAKLQEFYKNILGYSYSKRVRVSDNHNVGGGFSAETAGGKKIDKEQIELFHRFLTEQGFETAEIDNNGPRYGFDIMR